jgi:protein SCO1/2
MTFTACANSTTRLAGDGLPFYDSPDLTPRWTDEVAHTIGEFSLTTQTGAPITSDDLLGRVHVASFIFASCTELCPVLITRLSEVQTALASRDDALLVSYSVAPHHDTVEVLSQLGVERGIDPARWKLVTGDAETIYRLARESYFADDGLLDGQSWDELFLHTEKVLLVDALGRLRGVYNGSIPFEIAKLIADIDTLTDQAPAPLPS